MWTVNHFWGKIARKTARTFFSFYFKSDFNADIHTKLDIYIFCMFQLLCSVYTGFINKDYLHYSKFGLYRHVWLITLKCSLIVASCFKCITLLEPRILLTDTVHFEPKDHLLFQVWLIIHVCTNQTLNNVGNLC
jgi:hypothetical protein